MSPPDPVESTPGSVPSRARAVGSEVQLPGVARLPATPASSRLPRMILRPLAVVLVLALSACGFQLRDALTLPPDLGPVKVVSVDRASPLAESLARGLTRAGAVPATAETSDPTVLRIMAERWGDTPISVDSFGRAQEFTLRYAVVFELTKADGTKLVPVQSIELARDYISIPDNSLGTEGERDVLVTELRREMTASVMRRIDAVTRKSAAASPADGDGVSFSMPTAPVAPDAAAAAQKALEELDARSPPPTDDDSEVPTPR